MPWRRRRGGTWCISWTHYWCPRCRGCGGPMPSRWLGLEVVGGIGEGGGVGNWWKLQKLGGDGQNWRGGVWWVCLYGARVPGRGGGHLRVGLPLTRGTGIPRWGYQSTQQRGSNINKKPSTSHFTWDFTNNRWECNQKTRGTRPGKLAVGFESYQSWWPQLTLTFLGGRVDNANHLRIGWRMEWTLQDHSPSCPWEKCMNTHWFLASVSPIIPWSKGRLLGIHDARHSNPDPLGVLLHAGSDGWHSAWRQLRHVWPGFSFRDPLPVLHLVPSPAHPKKNHWYGPKDV